MAVVARFLPAFVLGHFRYSNLRSHRKILVIDGRIGFTGGMNIRHGNTLQDSCSHPIQDLHFRVEGPVVESRILQALESREVQGSEDLADQIRSAPGARRDADHRGSYLRRAGPDRR